jgi:hypothetical protein
MWSIATYGTEIWTLREVDQKYLEIFVICYWKRMEKISWNDRVRNEVLQRVEGEGNIINKIK